MLRRFRVDRGTKEDLLAWRSRSEIRDVEAGEERLGDEEIPAALARLKPRFLRALSKHFRRIVRYQDVVEDLFQELALRAVQKRGEIVDLDAWLMGTLFHLAYGWVRRRRTERAALETLRVVGTRRGSIPPDQERIAAVVDLERALKGLAEGGRRLVRLRLVEGLDPKEVSRVAGCSRESVRRMVVKQLRRMRSILLTRGGSTGFSVMGATEANKSMQEAPVRKGKDARKTHRPNEFKGSRDAALGALRDLGLGASAMSRVRVDDFDPVQRTLQLNSTVLDLPEEAAETLERWMRSRGSASGPLFLSSRRGAGALTVRALSLILGGLARGNVKPVLLRPARERLRNRAVEILYKAGIGPEQLSKIQIEHLMDDGVFIGRAKVELSDSEMKEVRAWVSLLRRPRGPVFVAIRGGGPAPIGSAGIRMILKSSGQWVPGRRGRRWQNGSQSREMRAIVDLWARLPTHLRRQAPQEAELAEVCRLVLEACHAGAHVMEALRVTGLNPELFLARLPEKEGQVFVPMLSEASDGKRDEEGAAHRLEREPHD